MFIGSHNTMSYLPPRRWWQWPLRIFARCQRRTLAEQIAAGIRVFDLRVYRDGDRWHFAHGLVSFRGAELYGVLEQLPPHSIVRLILERGRKNVMAFRALCQHLEAAHKHLTFIGGRRKKDWALLYDFAANKQYPDWLIFQHVSSMAADARWYEKILPCLYARRRKPSMDELAEGIHLYDFI